MKAIGLIRTSTAKQEVESQREEVISMIKADGYSDEDIIIVGNAGASAIKLDEQYMANINEVYRLIDGGNIICVYAWAIDRIGRHEEVLMAFKNHLISKGVNLKIKNPSLSLMDGGKLNPATELAFSLFATMARQEMEQKKARFMRAKARNNQEGRYNGGKIMFGYAINEKGVFIEDKKDAEIVRYIFREYVNTPKSTALIARECMELEMLPLYKQKKSADHFIQCLLKNKAYIGQHSKVKYPRLITDEMFENAQRKLADFRILPKVKYAQTPYYCQGIIREMRLFNMTDPDSAHTEIKPMRVKKSECSYVSYWESFSININNLDSLVIQVLDEIIREYDKNAAQHAVDVQKKRLASRIDALKENEKDISAKWRNWERLKEDSLISSEEAYREKAIKFKSDLNNARIERENAEADLKNLQDAKVEEVDLYALTDEGRQEMVRKYIASVIALKQDKYFSQIYISFVKPYMPSYSLTYNRKDKSFTTYSGEYGEPVTTPIRIIRDIKGRKRNYKGSRNGKQLDVQG